MSNLGRYQEFTTAAGQMGGVDQYLDALRRDALWQRGPWIALGGVLAGAASVLGIQRVAEKRQQARREAEQAEAVLRGEEG